MRTVVLIDGQSPSFYINFGLNISFAWNKWLRLVYLIDDKKAFLNWQEISLLNFTTRIFWPFKELVHLVKNTCSNQSLSAFCGGVYYTKEFKYQIWSNNFGIFIAYLQKT